MTEEQYNNYVTRGGSRAAGTSKMECFVIKRSILDVAAALDPSLQNPQFKSSTVFRSLSDTL